ncbi:hypothetical protein B0H14DRAFT_2631647 [Mycena olivaceomarginata]|nr:hypothetical protein B0H14DRAFT_2631647 [Mycena olivaceomarginata]
MSQVVPRPCIRAVEYKTRIQWPSESGIIKDYKPTRLISRRVRIATLTRRMESGAQGGFGGAQGQPVGVPVQGPGLISVGIADKANEMESPGAARRQRDGWSLGGCRRTTSESVVVQLECKTGLPEFWTSNGETVANILRTVNRNLGEVQVFFVELRAGEQSISYGMQSPSGRPTAVVPKLKYRNACRPGVAVRNRTKGSTTDLIQSKRWPAKWPWAKMMNIIYVDLFRGQGSRRQERIPPWKSPTYLVRFGTDERDPGTEDPRARKVASMFLVWHPRVAKEGTTGLGRGLQVEGLGYGGSGSEGVQHGFTTSNPAESSRSQPRKKTGECPRKERRVEDTACTIDDRDRNIVD